MPWGTVRRKFPLPGFSLGRKIKDWNIHVTCRLCGEVPKGPVFLLPESKRSGWLLLRTKATIWTSTGSLPSSLPRNSPLHPDQHKGPGRNPQLVASPWGGRVGTCSNVLAFPNGCPRDWFLLCLSQCPNGNQSTLDAWGPQRTKKNWAHCCCSWGLGVKQVELTQLGGRWGKWRVELASNVPDFKT